MERGGLAVHADVRDRAARADDLGAELERLRHADRLDRHVDAEPVRELEHARERILRAGIDRHVRAEGLGLRAARRGEIDRDDPAGRVELRRHDRGKPDRAGADDRDRVAGCDPAVQDADLVGGGKDVG